MFGTFSIGARLPAAPSSDQLVVVLRHREQGIDHVYAVRAGVVARILVDGRVEITVNASQRQVVVDVLAGQIVEIRAPTETLSTCEGAAPPELTVGGRAIVSDTDVNMRADPVVPSDPSSNVVATLSRGDRVTVIDGTICAYGGYWWQVRSDGGHTGWMREAGVRRYLARE